MFPHSLIVRSKLAPPRPQKFNLPRPRLTNLLLEARHHRLTIVQAGTGYGKSTALAALAQEAIPLIWYRLDGDDVDPQRFLAHLLNGFAFVLPGFSEAPLAALEAWSGNRGTVSWTLVVDTLINEISQSVDPDSPVFLALDDAHQINQASVPLQILDRIISLAPDNLHTILACRKPVELPGLLNWRVKGELLEIEQAELAFTSVEIDSLFRTRYDHDLTLEQAALLVDKIEGWPIALQLVWKNLQKENVATFAEAVTQLSGATGDLFSYLTQEVLAQQPPDLQAFLRLTSILRQMTAVRCDYLRQAHDSQEILDYLLEQGLFVVDLGEGQMRYHYLFRELLMQQLTAEAQQQAHQRAAEFAQKQGEDETAIYHWLQANAHEQAANLLERLGREMVRGGRLDTLSSWIGTLPADTLVNHPALLTYLGDISRLHSRFEVALGWYQQAEQHSRTLNNIPALGQALRGQARVYLDTVNPNQAEQLLQEALRLSDGFENRESRARLIELMSENLLNLGRVEEAKQYQIQADELRQEGPSHDELPVRILLRTGRLAEAQQILEAKAAEENREPILRPRAHRETLLLLSLILAYQGRQKRAMETAVEGTERGRLLESDFVIAVGYMREGHAWALLKNEAGYREAVRCYEAAIQISDKLDVPRLKVEASWGLCQAHGFRGDLETAVQTANQGIKLARMAGDEWIEAGIRAVMGASYVLAGEYEAASGWLAQAQTGFQECSDPYGESVSRLWQCLAWYRSDDTTRLERDIAVLLNLCQTHGYEMLFTRPTLLGPPDIRISVPLLLYARDCGREGAYAEDILAQMGLSELELHPGYQLRIQSLGTFRLWLGSEEVPHRAWQRKKARQLFMLFLVYRGQMLHREQICDLLWPEADPDDAVRDFKIAYSAMCNVLEPERKRHAPSAFILRKDVRYGLRPEADLWLDAAQFETLTTRGDRLVQENPAQALENYQQALALYGGDFLQAHPYYDWGNPEQERLLTLYLHASERVARSLAASGDWTEVVQVCQSILARDNCWEAAYRLLMRAYAGLGNRAQALQTYEQCRNALRDRWGVEPMGETAEIYESIRQSG